MRKFIAVSIVATALVCLLAPFALAEEAATAQSGSKLTYYAYAALAAASPSVLPPSAPVSVRVSVSARHARE